MNLESVGSACTPSKCGRHFSTQPAREGVYVLGADEEAI
jgi:hypothetical protein